MSLETFENTLMAEIESWAQANIPDIVVAFENGPVPEEDKIGSPWVDVSVRPYQGQLLSMGEKAGRNSGVLAVCVFTREGEGTEQARGIIRDLRAHLTGWRSAGGWLNYPTRMMPTTLRGWHKQGLMFPFTVDD